MVRELLWRPGAVLGESFEGLTSVWGVILCRLEPSKVATLSLAGIPSVLRPLATSYAIFLKVSPPESLRVVANAKEASTCSHRFSS